MSEAENHFIQQFKFKDDKVAPGRSVSYMKMGDLYISKISIDPGIKLGNTYHKKTRVMFFVSQGRVRFTFKQINTEQVQEIIIENEREAIHVPEFVASTTENIGDTKAVIIAFSNESLQSDDRFEYHVKDL